MKPVTLTPGDLSIAAILILACGLCSVLLSLRVHRPLLIAAGRMVVQLLLVGYALRLVFAVASPGVTLLAAAVMAGATVYEVGARQERRLRGGWHYAAGGAPVVLSTLIIVVLALTTTLRPHPWYDAREALPLTGIILGNVMNAVSLALNFFFTAAWRERAAIEARLALGEGRRVALGGVAAQALRTALIPTINQMAAAGLITMPGIMTGQILAGMDPLGAATYQILLMGLMVGGSFAGAVAALFCAALRITDARERLRLDRLRGSVG